MNELNILEDLLNYRISNEKKYNDSIITIRNPEARQVLTELRDDEMRGIIKLQERIERLKGKPFIVSKIFPKKTRF